MADLCARARAVKYLQSGKRRLIEAVEHLTRELGRPVRARDLNLYFRNRQDRPCFLGGVATNLKSAARDQGCDRLYRIGQIDSRTYYAPTNDNHWRRKLDAYRLRRDWDRRIKYPVLDDVRYLLGGRHDGMARNALAGWTEDVRHIHGQMVQLGTAPQGGLQSILEAGDEFAAPQYHPPSYPNNCFLTFREAQEWLKIEILRRCPEKHDERIIASRWLRHRAWPQCTVLGTPDPTAPLYLTHQVELIPVVRWPEPDENPDEAAAILEALAYSAVNP